MSPSLESIRREYTAGALSEEDLLPDPFAQFGVWLDDAFRAQLMEPSAMILATASPDGVPNCRVMLLKELDEHGFVFFTNYESAKGRELSDNPRATALFYWKELERQVRVTGSVEQLSNAASAAYFATRPRASQLAAWASHQSAEIADRNELVRAFERVREKFSQGEVPLPPRWGGFRLIPASFEFWQGRENRLHDRLVYRQAPAGAWSIVRISP